MKNELLISLALASASFQIPSDAAALETEEIVQTYQALNTETVKDYLFNHRDLADHLGGTPAKWKTREVGDGNLNLVFIVEGPKSSLVVKQALPYVRLVGESWPLPLARNHFEYMALAEEAKHTPERVPALYHHNETMALTAMEYLSPHIILRKGLVRGLKYPAMAEHLGTFLAETLFHTSDLFLSPSEKRDHMIRFASNSPMCKITEDLVFDDPYYESPLNHWTTPQLDEIAQEFREDVALKLAAQEMKWRFLNHAEALIHGDLHTGSIMVTETDTRVIDAEFAVYGPMGFDVGAIIGNLLLAYYAQPGQGKTLKARDAHAGWILEQIPIVWNTFSTKFGALCRQRSPSARGAAYPVLLNGDTPELEEAAIQQRLAAIWEDAVGFAGVKMIRRILGLAHVEDLDTIQDATLRAACEQRALLCARSMLLNRSDYPTPETLIDKAMAE